MTSIDPTQMRFAPAGLCFDATSEEPPRPARRAADFARPSHELHLESARGQSPFPRTALGSSFVGDCAAAYVPPAACGRITGGGVVVIDADRTARFSQPGSPRGGSSGEATGLVLAAWRSMRASSSRFLERRGESSEVAVIAATDPEERARGLSECDGSGLVATRVVHPDAIVAESATISDGAVILAGAVVEENARIGRAAIIGSGAVIESEAVIGDAAAIESRAVVSSGSRVGERALIGRGAIVAPDMFVGLGARVAYGHVVDRDVDPGALAGRPARRCR